MILVVMASHMGKPSSVVELGLAISVCAPAQLLLSMQNNVSIISGKLSLVDAMRTRINLLPVFLLIGLFGALFFSSILFLCFFLYRGSEFLYEVEMVECFRVGDYLDALYRTLQRAIFFLALSTSVLMLHGSLELSIAVAGIPMAIFTMARCLRKYAGRGVVVFNFALGGAAFIASLIVNLPRYYVVAADSLYAAFYSNMMTIILGGGVLYGALNNYMFARLCVQGKRGVQRFMNYSLLLFFFGIFLSFFILESTSIQSWIVSLFLGYKYIELSGGVMGFALLYLVLYFHSVLNYVFVYLDDAPIYLGSLGVYGVLMALLIYHNLSSALLGQKLVWFVCAVGVLYGIVCYFYLSFRLSVRRPGV